MPALIDGVDDAVGKAYGGWPDRLYLVGKDGRVAYAGARGPRGFDPKGWEQAILAEKKKGANSGDQGERPSKQEPRRGGDDR